MKPDEIKRYIEMLFDPMGLCSDCDNLFRNALGKVCCWVGESYFKPDDTIKETAGDCAQYKQNKYFFETRRK